MVAKKKKIHRKPRATKKAANRRSGKPTFTEQARKKQILEAAAQLFGAKGYDATSVDDIAALVGVSRGVIFYYFDGKRELGEQTFRSFLSNYGTYVNNRVSPKPEGLPQLLEFIDACLDYLDAHREDYMLYADLSGSFGSSNEGYEITANANRRTRDWLVRMIKHGQKNGEIRKVPATNLADIVQGVVDGLMELSALEPDAVSLTGCKRLLHSMIVDSIQA